MPLIQACVHDSQDTECSGEAQGATIPAACNAMTTPPTNTNLPDPDPDPGHPRWVEVRVCYQFTPILRDLPLLAFGDLWLQRTRTFTIPCYFALGSAECG
jgi:hypothetical protein